MTQSSARTSRNGSSVFARSAPRSPAAIELADLLELNLDAGNLDDAERAAHDALRVALSIEERLVTLSALVVSRESRQWRSVERGARGSAVEFASGDGQTEP